MLPVSDTVTHVFPPTDAALKQRVMANVNAKWNAMPDGMPEGIHRETDAWSETQPNDVTYNLLESHFSSEEPPQPSLPHTVAMGVDRAQKISYQSQLLPVPDTVALGVDRAHVVDAGASVLMVNYGGGVGSCVDSSDGGLRY